MLELQVISDITFARVEIYTTDDVERPNTIVLPLRVDKLPIMSVDRCTRKIRLWVRANGHCVALIDH